MRRWLTQALLVSCIDRLAFFRGQQAEASALWTHAVVDDRCSNGIVHRIRDMQVVVPEVLIYGDAAFGVESVELGGAFEADAPV